MVQHISQSIFLLWPTFTSPLSIINWHGIKIHIGYVVSNSLWIVGIGDHIDFWTGEGVTPYFN